MFNKSKVTLTFKKKNCPGYGTHIISDERIHNVLKKIGDKYDVKYKDVDLSKDVKKVVFICKNRDFLDIEKNIYDLFYGRIEDIKFK